MCLFFKTMKAVKVLSLILVLGTIPVIAFQYPSAASAKTTLQLTRRATLERGALYQPVWSPDGSLLAVTGALGIWLFDRHDVRAEPRLLSQVNRIVAFSPDSSFAASINATGNIVFWDTRSGKITRTFYALKERLIWINDLAFSPDGTQLAMAFGGGGTLRPTGGITVWEVATGNKIIDIRHKLEEPLRLAYSPDGRYLAVGSYGGSAIWDTRSWEATDLSVGGRLFDLSINADGTKIAFYSGYGGISIIDVGTLHNTEEGTTAFTSLAFSPTESEILALSGYQKVEIRNIKQKRVIAELPAGHQVSFSADGKFLTYVDRSGLYIYDTLTYTLREYFGGFNSNVGQMRFLGDGAWFVYERANNSLGFWNTQQPPSRELVMDVGLAKITAPILPAYIDFLLDVSEGGHTFYQLRLSKLPSPRPDIAILAPNEGCFSYTSQDLSVKIQDIATGEILHTLVGHKYPVCLSVFSPDGRLLVTADNDNLSYLRGNPNHAVYVWDVDTGERIGQLLDHAGSIGMNEVVFSPDGSHLALVHEQAVEIWDTANWTQLSRLSVFPEAYQQALFTSTGKIIITRDAWGKLQIWTSASGTILATGEVAHATRMMLSADDTLLAVATEQGTIEIWEITGLPR